MKNKDQQLLEEAYNKVGGEILNEYQLPSVKFRNKTYSENRTLYRLYVKFLKEPKQTFHWAGEFDTKEEAVQAFNRGHNLGVYKASDHEYIIKEVKISYSEKTVDQSPIMNLRDKLPELEGLI